MAIISLKKISPLLIGLIILTGCNDITKKQEATPEKKITEPDMSLQQKVWEQLSSEQKGRLEGNLKNTTVEKTIFHTRMVGSVPNNYDGKEVYRVSFKEKVSNPTIGDFDVFVDMENGKIIGIGLRD